MNVCNNFPYLSKQFIMNKIQPFVSGSEPSCTIIMSLCYNVTWREPQGCWECKVTAATPDGPRLWYRSTWSFSLLLWQSMVSLLILTKWGTSIPPIATVLSLSNNLRKKWKYVSHSWQTKNEVVQLVLEK